MNTVRKYANLTISLRKLILEEHIACMYLPKSF